MLPCYHAGRAEARTVILAGTVLVVDVSRPREQHSKKKKEQRENKHVHDYDNDGQGNTKSARPKNRHFALSRIIQKPRAARSPPDRRLSPPPFVRREKMRRCGSCSCRDCIIAPFRRDSTSKAYVFPRPTKHAHTCTTRTFVPCRKDSALPSRTKQ